jgi:hemoglobin
MASNFVYAALVVLAALVVAIYAAGCGMRQLAPGKSLYDRLGGVYSIAAVVNDFSDAILRSPKVGVNSPNPQLREWSRNQSISRLPGLKFMRTLWVCDVAGGPLRYHGTKPGATRLDLGHAHQHLHITSDEFDEVAKILATSLDKFHVPAAEKSQVLGAFLAHKKEVITGSL